jgi:hypothetical protein
MSNTHPFMFRGMVAAEDLPVKTEEVPIPLVKTPNWYRRIRNILEEAEKKGLEVRKCSFQPGWSITIPSGSTLYVDSIPELAAYVGGY